MQCWNGILCHAPHSNRVCVMSENISKGLGPDTRPGLPCLHSQSFFFATQSKSCGNPASNTTTTTTSYRRSRRNIKIKLKSLLNVVAGCKQCVARLSLSLPLALAAAAAAALWRVDGQINCISDASLRFCIRNRNTPSRESLTRHTGGGRVAGRVAPPSFVVPLLCRRGRGRAGANYCTRLSRRSLFGEAGMLGIVRPSIPRLPLIFYSRCCWLPGQGCQRV